VRAARLLATQIAMYLADDMCHEDDPGHHHSADRDVVVMD
jgi:hypothetical protein